MAEANTKSTIITNLDASPAVMNSGKIAGGVLRSQVGAVEVAAADDNNSVYRFARVHTSHIVRAINIWNDAIQSGNDFNLGAHDTAERGGAAILDNAWGDAITMVSARAAAGPLNAVFENLNIDKIEKRVWEVLGLTSDPGKYVDITLTGIAVGSGAGTISMEVVYVDGS